MQKTTLFRKEIRFVMLKRKLTEKKKNEKIEKFVNVIKKSSESEKKKAEERKKEKQKGKPKGYQAKKFGVFAFWFIFISVSLVSLITALSNGNDDKEIKIVENKATSTEAVEFGKDFLYKYYNWTNMDQYNNDLKNHRKELLGRYVTKDLLETVTKTSDLWNAELALDNITLKKSEDVGDNRGYLTYKVVPTFTKTEKGMNTEELQGKEQSVRKVQYVMLKVYYDEKKDRFVIYDLPSYVNNSEGKNTVKVASETKGLFTSSDAEERKVVQEFLETFFDTYTNDSVEKLSYLFENQKAVYGLNQSLRFEDLKDFTIYKGRNDDEKVVVAEVKLSDPDTDMEFLSRYSMVIVHTKQGYLVRSFNDKQAIDKIVNKENDDTEDDTETEQN